MKTECTTDRFWFQSLGRREVVGAFDGGTISSDAGGLLLREVEQRTGIIRQLAACFADHRDPELIEHTVQDLVAQRIYGLALAQAQCDTIRLKLLKIGAQIRVTVRKVWVALAEGCPYEGVFRQVYQNLLAMRPTWVPCRC
jgi:hypothetical protein